MRGPPAGSGSSHKLPPPARGWVYGSVRLHTILARAQRHPMQAGLMLQKPGGGLPTELISPTREFLQSDLADPNRLGKVG
jgi:hypothetical protein